MARRTCPACPKRYAGLVADDCPVCNGVGVIGLHPAALYRSDPAVVARAVDLFLESACREAAAVHAPGGTGRLEALAAAAQRLRDARVTTAPLGVAEGDAAYTPEYPATRVVDAYAARMSRELGQAVKPSDVANLDAAKVTHAADDRPRAHGLLPRTSAAGFPSQLAMAADPTDALGPDTRARVYAEQASDRSAGVLAHAAVRAADKVARRATS